MPLLIAVALAVVLTPAAGRLGRALGMVDRPEDPSLAIHAAPVPLLGGPAVAVSAAVALLVAGRALDPWVLGGIGVAFATGIVDDRRPLPAWVRVALLAVAGAGLAAGTPRLAVLGAATAPVVVALVLATTNAVNLIDGQNGLSGGLGAIALMGLLLLGIADPGAHAAALALAGGLAGFVAWNLPGRIFLGNGGAYALGTAVAWMAVEAARGGGWRGLLAAGVALGVFAFELVSTVARRLHAGDGVMVGDRFHTYDVLALRIGRSGSTLAFWGLGAIAAGAARLVAAVPLAAGGAVAAGLAACIWAVSGPRDDRVAAKE